LLPRSWFEDAIDEAGVAASFDPDRSAPLNAVRRSAADLLLIHGTADTQVPLRHSQALVSAAAGRARLITVPGAEHASMPADATGVIRRETLSWFDARFERARCPALPR
jgi:dipeptidyl aminopeptidase/acylaminoacyl peptidase